MTTTIIIAFCLLLLIAYLFDLTASKTRIPSVVMLLLLGWVVRQILDLTNNQLPNFSIALPVLGTVGLILIVLEGSLELELNRTKFSLVKKSFLGAFFPMIALGASLSYLFHTIGGFNLKDSLLNAIPLCVISSAIAIPSVKNLNDRFREFITYESSFSDIIGVVLFNFIALNDQIHFNSFSQFILQLILISVISLIATAGLSYLLNRIEHRIKFVPIILLIVLIYATSKIYHLPALLFIMLFGLSIGNLDELKSFSWMQRFKPELLNVEVKKFHELIGEVAFLVRALFFLLFGYLIDSREVLNSDTFFWAVGVMGLIVLFRYLQLRFSNLPIRPLLFVAPRGLITILLYLSIDQTRAIPLVNRSLIIQVILLSALFMMVGLMLKKRDQPMDDFPEPNF